AGVGEAAHDGEPSSNGVRSGREPLVRQGLPCGQDRDVVVGQEAAKAGSEVVSLAAGGCDDNEGAAGRAVFAVVGGSARSREESQQTGTNARGRDEVELTAGAHRLDSARDG